MALFPSSTKSIKWAELALVNETTAIEVNIISFFTQNGQGVDEWSSYNLYALIIGLIIGLIKQVEKTIHDHRALDSSKADIRSNRVSNQGC